MPQGGSATGPFGFQEPPISTSTSPYLTSGILQTWWSCWTATPTASWSVSMEGTTHLCHLTSLWILSFCISSLIASIRPRDSLSYTKVRLPCVSWALNSSCREVRESVATDSACRFSHQPFHSSYMFRYTEESWDLSICCVRNSKHSFHGRIKRTSKRTS